jgi:hypothetical protein
MAQNLLKALLLITFVVALSFYEVDAVKCYNSLSGNVQDGCEVCQKTESFTGSSTGTIIIQACTSSSVCTVFDKRVDNVGLKNTCCKSDLCNSATSLRITAQTAIVLATVTLFYLCRQ